MNRISTILSLIEQAPRLFETEEEKAHWITVIIPSLEEDQLAKIQKILEEYLLEMERIDEEFSTKSGHDSGDLMERYRARMRQMKQDQVENLHQAEAKDRAEEAADIEGIEDQLSRMLY